MLNYEQTMEILKSFYDECYVFWRRNECSPQEARQYAIRDIECIAHDPYEPCGKCVDLNAKRDFIEEKRR